MRDVVLLKTTMEMVSLLNVVTGTTQQSWIACQNKLIFHDQPAYDKAKEMKWIGL